LPLVLQKVELLLQLPHERLEVLPSSGHSPFIEIEERPQMLRAEMSIVLRGCSGSDDGLPIGDRVNALV